MRRYHESYYQIKDLPQIPAGAMWYVDGTDAGQVDVFVVKHGTIVADAQHNAWVKTVAAKFILASNGLNREFFESRGVQPVEVEEIPHSQVSLPTSTEKSEEEKNTHSQAKNLNPKLTEIPMELPKKLSIGQRIIRFLRSTESILLFSLLALVAQTPHTATVFERIAQSNWDVVAAGIHAYVYAISAEIGILIFVLHARKMISYFFAFIAVVINLLYYWPGMQAGVDWVSAFVISIFLPTIIALYSDQIDREVVHVEKR